MHDQPIRGCRDFGGSSMTAAQDLHDQGVVLIHVLTIYPTHLRLLELVREITAGSSDFAEGDRIERAVRDLVGVGLLFRNDGLVLPTRAALRFNEILGELLAGIEWQSPEMQIGKFKIPDPEENEPPRSSSER